MPSAPKQVGGRSDDDRGSTRSRTRHRELTHFVGRASEVLQLKALVQSARLVSLVGPPGIGKTRLSRELLDTLPAERTVFCDLRNVHTADGLVSKLAEGLDGHVESSPDLTTLSAAIAEALSSRPHDVVVLDNFEGLVPSGLKVLNHWLEGAPDCCFLVTTRRMLRLRGEHAFELKPLALSASSGARSEAAELFIDRAKAAEPAFDPDPEPDVEALVRHLEGLPLALEIAASQMRRLRPRELLEQIQKGPTITIEAAERDTERRHRSLRAAIEASWTALEPYERAALSQLSTCHQGFSLDAATSIVDLTAFADAPPMETVVGSLREASLIRVDERNDPSLPLRWDMYEAIREYAATFPTRGAEARHASHYLAIGQQCVQGIVTPKESRVRAILHRELGNLRSAFGWFLDVGGAHHGVHAAELALVLYEIHRPSKPGLAIPILTRALDGLADAREDLRALLYTARGACHRVVGASSHAEADFHAARAYVECGTVFEATLDLERAALDLWRGNIRRARELLRRTADYASENALPRLESRARRWLGEVLSLGFHDRSALIEFDRALDLAVTEGDRRTSAAIRLSRAIAHIYQPGPEDPVEELAAVISEAQDLQDHEIEALAEQAMGGFLLDRGEYASSRAHLNRALDVSQANGLRRHRACTEVWIGCLDEEEQRPAPPTVREASTATVFHAIGDQRTEAFAWIELGAETARREDVQRGVDLIARGERLATDSGDEAIHLLAEIQRARIELIESQRMATTDELRRARSLCQTAVARVETATQLRVSSEDDARSAPFVLASSVEARWALRLFERELSAVLAGQRVLRVASDGGRFQLGDEPPVSLPNGPVIRRALVVFAQKHNDAPGEAMAVAEVVKRCWPEERVSNEVGSQRVRQVVARLRKAGMHRVLLHTEKGYFLDPELRVEVE